MKKRQIAMNWLTKFSNKIFIYIFVSLIFSGTVCAETIMGGIRKEYKQQESRAVQIPYNEPQYSTGAILAYNRGIEEYNLSNYDKSIEAFKFAIQQEPRFADAYFNLGILYDYFSNSSNALIAFNRAYAINKKDDEALFYVIKSYINIGDNAGANFYLKKMPKESEFYQKAQELVIN